MWLLAESLVIGPSFMTSLLCLVAGVGGTLFIQRLRGGQAKAGQTNPVAEMAMTAAFAANREDLGFFTNLFHALATNNRQQLQEAVTKLGWHLEQGSLADLLEDFVHRRVKVLLAKPDDRKQLLALVSKEIGEDIEQLVAAKQAKSITLTATPLASILLALALVLGASSTGLAYGPERFEPTQRVACVDRPVMTAPSSTPARLVYVTSSHHCSRSSQSVGWWHRGPARRLVSAPFRFFGRWAPLRRLFGRW
jgi:hypothetical protein